MKKASLFCSILMLVPIVLFVGCGQKGPLYLPQPAKPSPDAPQAVPAPAKTAPVPESTKQATGN